MKFESQIEQLTNSTVSVFEDCIVENGAIIAANSDMAYYPETAVDYRYVWPRDAAFIIYAADTLGMTTDIKANFVQWLLDRAESFSESGTLIKRYGTNGRHDRRYGHQYQPDQAGTMLWVLHHTTPDADQRIDSTISLLASGLSRCWNESHFIHPDPTCRTIQDIWEDQEISVDKERRVFTYSLAASLYGLEQAITRLGDKAGVIGEAWLSAVETMVATMQKTEAQHYTWKIPSQSDDRLVDASLCGLMWPFEVQQPQAHGIDTIMKIGQTLLVPGRGIKRYSDDKYDGVCKETSPPEGGAGTWPLLSFWYAIALKKTGLSDQADQVYRETLELLPNDYIPEQILSADRTDRPPTPLAWAHAMFIIASKELGYFD